MKVLFVTDTHLTGRGPSSRTDNYVEAIFEKLEELKTVIADEGIDLVIHGGDVFDKPVVSYQLTGMLANYIRSTNVPWYVVPGNHDLFGYNLKSLPQTSLGLLQEAGVIQVLTREYGRLEFTTPEGTTYSFEGQEYHMDIDKRTPSLDYYVTGQANYKFLIPHSMLLDKDYFPGVPHTRTKDLAGETEADFVLVGHYHDGLTDTVMHNGHKIEVLNPGSMTRDEASKGNLKRKPGYVLIELTNMPMLEYREFKCAKEGIEIFDRSHITAKLSKDRYLEAFEQKLGDAPVAATDIRTVLDGLIQTSTVEAAVSTGARERLEAAEKALGDATHQMAGFVEKPHNLAISKVIIKGFQSHEDTVVDFGPGLNAIIGSSDSGKSSIIRALRFALYNEPRGADFIRHSSTNAEVEVRFSDGSFLKRARTRSSAGSYIIGAPDGTETEIKGFTNHLPVDIPNTHQMPQIQLTKDLEATLSIGYQMDSAFLIGESPGTRASIIGKLAGVDLVDSAMREIGKEVLSDSKDLKRLKEEKLETATQLAAYDDLPQEKQRLEQAEQLLKEIRETDAKLQELRAIDAEWRAKTTEMIQAEYDIHQLRTTLQHESFADELKRDFERLQQLMNFRDERDVLDRTIGESYRAAQEADALLSGAHEIDLLKRQAREMGVFEQLKNERDALLREQAELERSLQELPVIPDQKEVLELQALCQKQRELSVIQTERDRLMEAIRNDTALLAQAENDIIEAQQHYQHILEQNGTCPTCYQTIAKGELIHAN